MQEVVDLISNWVWSSALVYLCLGAGLFFSIATKFLQVRQVKEMARLLAKGNASERGISSFQALTVSLSGRVGTGNIAGVSAAIGFGGPGAVFWMWVVAFLGAATSYIECTLGQIYKEEYQGQYRGGPAYYFEKALGMRWYGILFAIVTVISCGLLLPGVQSNSIGNAVQLTLGEGPIYNTFIGEISLIKALVALVIVTLVGFIIFGGVKRIARFTQIVVPFMALAYILTALVIIGINIIALPAVIALIIGDAFNPMAGVGAAVGWGVKRGIYSNEAGQGSGPHMAAAAEVQHPAQQGLVQAFAVYIDTLFVCTATALMILITGAYNVIGLGPEPVLMQISPDIIANSPGFTQTAVESMLPGIGEPFIAVALFFFAFTTILAYYYVADTNVTYLQDRLRLPGLSSLVKVGVMGSTFYGTVKAANLAWALGDIGVGLMAWFNIVGIVVIFFMAKPALKALLDYQRQQKAGVTEYRFDPLALGIKNAAFWERKAHEDNTTP